MKLFDFDCFILYHYNKYTTAAKAARRKRFCIMKISGEFKKYSRITFDFDIPTDSIKIIRPDGSADTVHAFIYQPITVGYDSEGIEKTESVGKTCQKCRYTPDFSGTAKIKAYHGNTLLEETEINIGESDCHGYIEISQNDKKYFSYTDGTPFFVIGINTAFPTSYGKSDGTEFGLSGSHKYIGLRQYERWFKKLSQNGVNVARVWLGHEYFTPDTENAFDFDYAQFSKIDMLFDLAKKYHIKLKITLEQFRFFDYDRIADSDSYGDDVFRKFNKKLYCNGKRCEDIDEWLSGNIWREAWLAKVREFAKRYSGDTELFAVELWNEMNCLYVRDSYLNIYDWNKQILPKVQSMFPKHLVVNSLGSLDLELAKQMYDNFCWDKVSFVQIHRYLDQGAGYDDCHSSPIDMIRGAFERIDTDKPVYIAETGAVNNCHSGPFKFYVNDDDGIIFTDTVYTPVFMKSCGAGSVWHWDERYVEAKNLYGLFKPLSVLTSNTEFDKEDFEPLSISDKNINVLLLKGKTVTLGYIRNTDYNWENVLRDLKNVSSVDVFKISLDSIKSIELIPVWDNDKTSAVFDSESVTFKNITIGALFKIRMI